MTSLDALADRWEAAWSGRDPAAFAAICAPDVHYEDPLTTRPLCGPSAIGEHAARLWTGFPDVQMTRSGERLTDGRYTAVPVKVMGTNVGAIEGLPPSNNFVSVHVVFYCELDGARRLFWRVRAFYDAYAVGAALGVLPRHGTLRQRALLMLQGYGLRLGR